MTADPIPPRAAAAAGDASYIVATRDQSMVGAVGPNATVNQYLTVERRISWPLIPSPAPGMVSAYQYRNLAGQIPLSGSVVLSGPSGYGKTQIAAGIFAESQSDLRLWVPAGSSDGVLDAYAQAAIVLELAGPDAGTAQLAGLFLGWLTATNRTWLIVLDNLDRPDRLDQANRSSGHLWPPAQANGLTLTTTTSRDPALTGGGRTRLNIDVYTPAEAAAYLNERLAPAYDMGELPGGALENAADLADDLGRYPLALSQAAALILADALTIDQYRIKVTEQRLDQVFTDLAPADGYARTVHGTWSLATERAETQTRGLSRHLLLALAVLDHSGAPDTLLDTTSFLDYMAAGNEHHSARVDENGAVPDVTDADPLTSRNVRAALRVLHRLSLITHLPGQAPSALLIHPLTARIVREQATPGQLDEAIRAAANSLVECWPTIKIDTPLATVLRRNATAITSHDRHHALWNQERYNGLHPMLFQHGDSLGRSGQLRPAINHYTRLVTLGTEVLGPDHPHTLTARHELATWLGRSGNPAGASAALQALVVDRSRVLGPKHPDTLTTRHSLASRRGQGGDATGAFSALETLLTDRLDVLGPKHPDTLTTRHNLAYWQGRVGDPAGALVALGALLVDRVEVLGPRHPDTLSTRHAIASHRGQTGDPAGAVAALEALLADRQHILGPDHPDTLTTRAHLATWRRTAGNPEAAGLLQTLLADRQRILGPDHPHTLLTRADLARWRGEAGDPAGAADAYGLLLSDQLRVHGPHHPNTIKTQADLAYWRNKAGQEL